MDGSTNIASYIYPNMTGMYSGYALYVGFLLKYNFYNKVLKITMYYSDSKSGTDQLSVTFCDAGSLQQIDTTGNIPAIGSSIKTSSVIISGIPRTTTSATTFTGTFTVSPPYGDNTLCYFSAMGTTNYKCTVTKITLQ